MMRFLTRNTSAHDDKEKFSRLKQQSKLAINSLLRFQEEYQTLHCVLVIGQPEAGKSTLCASFGKLVFSNQANLIHDQKNPEFVFEVYLHNDTLFFHIPQDFFLFSEMQIQQRLWHYFATQLGKHRSYLTISRCMVCVDLQDFLTRNKVSNETRLAQITLALNVLGAGLKHRLDIALFFTKADLMPGFTEFFEHESKEFLEQPWGMSLENTDEETLRSECDLLIQKVNERLLWSLHHEVHLDNLHLIKTFPLILETVKQKISSILPVAIEPWTQNRYLKPRELYFVSCRQVRELTETLNTGKTNIKLHQKQDHHKVFFVKHALEHQCHYSKTGTTSHTEKATRFIFVLLCGLLFIAFVLYNAQQFARHITSIESANKILDTGLAFEKNAHTEPKLKDVTRELNKISNAWQTLEKNQQSSLLETYIFTRDTTVEIQLKNVYQRIISQQWLPLITQALESYINRNLSSQPANAYIAFQLYLMLSQPGSSIDTEYLHAHLGDLLGNDVAPQHVLTNNLHKNILVLDENSPFVKKTQATFSELPANKLAYILLFASIDSHHPLSLSSTISADQLSLKINPMFDNISEIYTKSAFDDIYKKRLPAVVSEVIYGNKVLGTYHHDTTSEKDLLNQLQTEYVNLYSDAWEQAINHIDLAPVSSLDELAAQLKILTSIDSPILNLLNLVQKNTSIPQIEQNSAFLSEFNRILTKESKPDNNALYRSFTLLIKLRDQILVLKNGNTPETTCTLLANENSSTPENPSTAKQIHFIATQLPLPIQSWLQQIVDSYYTLLQQQAADCS